eukprot:scaffold3263_cov128-Skeletonema_menzelii.AAC.2
MPQAGGTPGLWQAPLTNRRYNTTPANGRVHLHRLARWQSLQGGSHSQLVLRGRFAGAEHKAKNRVPTMERKYKSSSATATNVSPPST